MKRKHLTVVFFSVMTLAATPRAMNQFNNYANALTNQVQAEWLQFLVGISSPTERQEDPTAQPLRQQPLCSDQASNDRVESPKTPVVAKVRSRSAKARNRSSEFAFTKQEIAKFDKSTAIEFDQVQFDMKALAKVLRTLPNIGEVPPGLATGRTKAAFLRSFVRSAKRSANKARPELVRGLSPIARTNATPVVPMRVSFTPDCTEPVGVEPDDIARQGNDSSSVVEESMH
jgi:hypothetical protein